MRTSKHMGDVPGLGRDAGGLPDLSEGSPDTRAAAKTKTRAGRVSVDRPALHSAVAGSPRTCREHDCPAPSGGACPRGSADPLRVCARQGVCAVALSPRLPASAGGKHRCQQDSLLSVGQAWAARAGLLFSACPENSASVGVRNFSGKAKPFLAFGLDFREAAATRTPEAGREPLCGSEVRPRQEQLPSCGPGDSKVTVSYLSQKTQDTHLPSAWQTPR